MAWLLALLGVAPAALAAPRAVGPPTLAFPAIDPEALLRRDALDEAPGPLRFAEPLEVLLTPATDGRWSAQDGSLRWELAVEIPGATDLNFGFGRFLPPQGAQLTITGGDVTLGPWGRESASSGQLWTPVVRGSRAVIALTVPAGAAPDGVDVRLTRVGAGYRDILGELERPVVMSGACNIDVACPQGDAWRGEIRSVVRYSVGGGGLCTATLLMDVPRTFRPFMLSADHCGVDAGQAPTVVAYWSYQASTCNGPRDGAGNAVTQSGAQHRASLLASDFVLFEMDAPPPVTADAYWSGWDRSDAPPQASVAIHHPNGDEKAISFDDDPLTKGENCIRRPGQFPDTHWYVGQYEAGTTEPGSSGCALYDAASHALVGTLSGGNALCGVLDYDCYGRFARHWDTGAAPSERLREWLDPAGTGVMSVQGGQPGATIQVSSFDVQDACSAGGNGVAEPGEDLTLVVSLVGFGSFTNVAGTLTSRTPGVVFGDASATWPDLAPSIAAASDSPHLSLSLPTSAACLSSLDLDLTVASAEGGPYVLPMSIPVGAPGAVSDAPQPIADLAASQSRMVVTQGVTLTDVDVHVRLTHGYIGDLTIRVQSPSGRTVYLIDRPGDPAVNGGCRDDDMDATFDDAGPAPLENVCAGSTPWFTGTARPSTPLSGFDGDTTQGTWLLIVEDQGVGDVGRIESWDLITTPPIAAQCVTCGTCPGQPIAETVPDVLMVTKGAGGSVVLTYPGAASGCASGVQVRMAPTARPGAGAGRFPVDPPFTNVTPDDLDAGPAYRHVPPPGDAYYLVVEDLFDSPGPSGSYGY